jgi:outer membrane protein TolC
LEALEDMENDLTSYKNEMVRNGSLRASVKQNRRAADLSQQQFKSGFTGLLDVLVAQGNVLDAESALADSDAALRKDLVNIYTASGGGWDIE